MRYAVILLSLLFIAGCKTGKDKITITSEPSAYPLLDSAGTGKDFVLARRAEMNRFMETDSLSPFNAKGKVTFHPLRYFDYDSSFIFQSILTRYPNPATVTITGTKGEARQVLAYGYLTIQYGNNAHKLNVYQGNSKNYGIYYSIWLTDETTGSETYHVGRYLDFTPSMDPEYLYTLDFNMLYNPYCSYSDAYSCAVPGKEDHLPFAVRAGEKKFHD